MAPLTWMGALALCSLAGANPLPTPTLAPKQDSPGCTTTTVVTGGSPPPPETWEPTRTFTIYTATTTASQAVDCHGCAAIDVATLIIDYAYPTGPEPSVSIVTAPGPSTVTQPYCSTESLPSYAGASSPPAAPPAGGKFEQGPSGSCTRVLYQIPRLTFGPTETHWTTTTTETSRVDCGDCEHLSFTRFPLGVPPVARFTATTTVSGPSTTTVFECGATADPVRTRHFGLPVQPTAARQ